MMSEPINCDGTLNCPHHGDGDCRENTVTGVIEATPEEIEAEANRAYQVWLKENYQKLRSMLADESLLLAWNAGRAYERGE